MELIMQSFFDTEQGAIIVGALLLICYIIYKFKKYKK